MALCSALNDEGEMVPCEKKEALYHQIRLKPCHIPCRKKLNQVGTNLVFDANNGIPKLPTRKRSLNYIAFFGINFPETAHWAGVS